MPFHSHENVQAAATRGSREPNPWKPSLHELLIMISLSIVSLMVSLDATVVVTALNALITDLRGSTTQAFWVGTSYMLVYAVTMPFTAALSDIFGRPICLLASLGLFTLGSIVCAAGKNIAALLVGRCIQGLGTGGIIIVSLIILTDIVPLRYRSTYYGFIQGAWALGTCIGPLIGGVFAETTTWRWIFYLMFPFCFIGFATIPWLLNLKPRTATLGEKLNRVDVVGGFLFISSSTSFLIAICWGGTQYPWSNARTLLPLILGVIGLAIALLWEGRYAMEPFLRRSLFHCRSSFAAYAGALIQGVHLSALLYYLPFYFSSVKQKSPIQTGLDVLPISLSLIPTSIIVGIVITKVNGFRWAIWAGWVFVTLGSGLLILWDIDTSTAAWVIILIIVGIGHGLILNSLNFATQAICLPHDEAAAAAMYGFLRSFGSALGIGIGSSIFQNVMSSELRRLGLPIEIANNSEAYIQVLKNMPPSEFKTNILHSYVEGFRGIFGTLCAAAGVTGIVSLTIGRYSLDKELDSEHRLEENEMLRKIRFRRKLWGGAKKLPSGSVTLKATRSGQDRTVKEDNQNVDGV